MLSIAKIEANRKNALKSTGPQTNMGVAASSKNALRHGLSATSNVVLESVEDASEYDRLVSDVIADLDARGTVETLLAERVAQLFWRLKRVTRFETERLSQWHWDKLPTIAILDATLRQQEQRKALGRALGHLFLPEDHELNSETVSLVLGAFMQCLSDSQREAFCGTDRDPMAALAANNVLGRDTITVGCLLVFLREAEKRVEIAGGQFTFNAIGVHPDVESTNLIAAVYEHYLGLNRQWDRMDQGDMSTLERERTNALLLQLSAAGIVDRYEPRLRRDLSRTLKDLQDLQERRRVCVRPADQGARL